ncbi:uncharacterized protein [Drosophila takahashii]|uniref:uncharacterized protein n=1 Tax=Drosophila takahashii TaxID=29030 RepID=UPI00389937A9
MVKKATIALYASKKMLSSTWGLAYIFQAEVCAIRKAAEVAQNINRPHDVVNLFVDSQAAIRSMQSSRVSFKNMMASREAIDKLSTTKSVRIYWVPSHQGIDGNETADVFAKEGVVLTNDRTENVPVSLQTLQSSLEKQADTRAKSKWRNTETCRISRFMCKERNDKLSQYVLRLPRKDCRLLDLIALKDELISLLSKAQFNLRKWSSNCYALLKSLPKEISKVYDPLGLLGPTTVLTMELHRFADASPQAYAVVIYSRVKVNNGYALNLIMSKTRVAPIKSVSIPRLKLKAAHLLSKLISLVKQSLTVPISRINCWSDSEIVLHWLSSPPRTWNTYVCNHTAEIIETCPHSCWQHIRSGDNPADCASRGILPKDLLDHPIWWNEPAWLFQSRTTWPPVKAKFVLSTEEEASLEVKADSKVNLHISDDGNSLTCLINKTSSWSRLVRILSYCFRFVHRLRGRNQLSPFLSAWELQYARSRIFTHVQREFFKVEYKQLSTGQQLKENSKLIRYTPFLDEQSVIRVGGRIDNSMANYDAKHPIILPKESPIAALLVQYQQDKTAA